MLQVGVFSQCSFAEDKCTEGTSYCPSATGRTGCIVVIVKQ